jgi:hypothetical protein
MTRFHISIRASFLLLILGMIPSCKSPTGGDQIVTSQYKRITVTSIRASLTGAIFDSVSEDGYPSYRAEDSLSFPLEGQDGVVLSSSSPTNGSDSNFFIGSTSGVGFRGVLLLDQLHHTLSGNFSSYINRGTNPKIDGITTYNEEIRYQDLPFTDTDSSIAVDTPLSLANLTFAQYEYTDRHESCSGSFYGHSLWFEHLHGFTSTARLHMHIRYHQ